MENTKRYCFLGDSITKGVGSAKCFTEYIGEMTGAEIHNFGVNGARACHLASQIARMEQTVGDAFDCLFILIGTNDFNSSTIPGEWFTESEETLPTGYDEKGGIIGYQKRKKRSFVMDKTTFRGVLNVTLSYLREKYADKRIILMTPIHRGFAFFGKTNYQPEELYANALGLYPETYVRIIREAADIWACECIDLYRDSGLFPMSTVNAELYFHDVQNDRLHPNANGHERLAETIVRYLKN